MAACGELNFKKMIFIGLVGALKKEFGLGDICTPSFSIPGGYTNTDLIEMETASFYPMADLLEVPSVALLVVSDNSATSAALIGRTEKEQAQYNYGRRVVLPDMILTLAKNR